ncbi:amidohydrolase family protein [Ornithinibacillus sp. L9]|uniref:Amidohydrolase family protein n=1 Tax=Ornithinibacillus caprae TaxID=2678566 RepID=A0A6N8FDS0_9BACI|nr:amidohydrolase [Ornithinibacillus caprae]MUK87341.1 amidohydrolase family protein [Ornithinibacillus caprae]
MSTFDLVIKNANILTIDEKNPKAGSLAVSDGRIKKVWLQPEPPSDELYITKDTEVIDLQRKTLIPGFVDTHNHLLMYAQFRKQANCSTPPNKNISDILKRVKDLAEETPEGEWVMGWGYDDTLLEEKRHPTRDELDAVAPNHPVFLRHISVHFAAANSKALELAGVNEESPDPKGGHFGRDENGRLNGVLHELPALDPVQAIIPEPSADELATLIGEASQDYLAQGITTSSDAGVGLDQGISEYEAHIKASANGDNPLRMRLMLLHYLLNDEFKDYTAQQLDEEIQARTNGNAKLDSAKHFQDGSIQGMTGALRKPYYNDPTVYGELLNDQDTFNETILHLHKRGFRITIHGNGDRAIGSILDAYEYALENEPRSDHRHRIEHVQTATSEDLDRFKRLDVAASFFINHVFYWGDRHKNIFLGPERASRMNPLADASKRKLLYTLHSDCPITPISPLFSIWAAVNRVTREGHVLGAEQRISVEKALRTMTIDGSKLNFDEENTGSIEVGKLADFAVLDADPTTIDPMKIKDIKVIATFIGGEKVYT